MIGDTGVMPVENLDFMGADEQVPDPVRRYACSMLEEAGWDDLRYRIESDAFIRAMWESRGEQWEDDWKEHWTGGAYSLQSSDVRLRIAFVYMEGSEWSYQVLYSQLGPDQSVLAQIEGLLTAHFVGYIDWEQKKQATSQALSLEGTEETTNLFKGYAMCRRLLIDGIGDFEDVYFATFEAYKALAGHLRGGPVGSPEAGLKWLLEIASDSWPVGQTRSRNFTYSPFA